jgi:hypothetical protein
MKHSSPSLLSELQTARHQYGAGCASRVEKLLIATAACEFPDAESLIHYHDSLLFLRAFPQSRNVAKLADKLLQGIEGWVERLRGSGADMEQFDSEEFSGIAGTVIYDTFTYEVARWLAEQHGSEIAVEWEPEDHARQLWSSLPQVLPLLADDCLVEADTPYLRWLSSAAGGEDQILAWVLQRLEGSPLNMLQRTSWYDALQINISWDLRNSPASRTRARRNPAEMYYHRSPLIRRNQVSLEQELNSAPLPVRKVPQQEAKEILNLVRDALTVRYRELWGTTRGDPNQMLQADVGRGVHIFLWGLPPDRRLPLRAYHAGLTLKNGVPINYIEGISLFDWMEVGFNTFYAFREGETAWIYAKVLHLLHQVTDTACFSVYPYQLGADNEEAIKSGAFWFYRKLGFRPGSPKALAIAQREEKKIAGDPDYRTSARTLRRLAAEHVFYEFGDGPRGLWDRFTTRNIGFAVERHMAENFHGDADKMRCGAVAALAKQLHVSPAKWNETEQSAFTDFAVVLALAPELSVWAKAQKQALLGIIRAKAGQDEAQYLRRMQRHKELKRIFLRLGSATLSSS